MNEEHSILKLGLQGKKIVFILTNTRDSGVVQTQCEQMDPVTRKRFENKTRKKKKLNLKKSLGSNFFL